MRKILAGIFIILTVASAGAQAQKKLTILHVNDTHSHLEPERSSPEAGKGGAIERAAYVDSVRKADGKRNVLVLHAGDFSQGTSYFSILGGDIEIDIINAMGYDCITLGNHEFDNGVEELARRLKSVHCPIVVANYDFSGLELGKYISPYAIVRKAGLKIGIIGLLPDISTLVSREVVDRIPSFDNAEVVNRWASFLKEDKKCDLVIALTHIGLVGEGNTDQELVRSTRNIDIVVGGHSHTFIDRPQVEKNLDGREVPIVQDGCWGLLYGNMKVTVDK